MRALIIIAAAAVQIVGSSSTTSHVARSCAYGTGAPLDSLRAIPRRLFPEVLDSAQRADSLEVALVFDSECRLVHSAIARHAQQPAHANDGIARLIPSAAHDDYVVSGYLEDRGAAARPLVVWGVRRAVPGEHVAASR